MQKSKQKYHISMEKYNIKKGLIVYTCIVLVFGGCIQAINDFGGHGVCQKGNKTSV